MGCHPHPSCTGKALGFGVASFKVWLQMRFVPKQAVRRADPASDSLDHRSRSMLIATQPLYNELRHALRHALHSRFPPLRFARALH